MARRKDAQKPPAKGPVAAPPAAARPASKPAKAPPPRRPSPLRIVFLCFRIALCAFALYVLYKRLHAKPTPKDTLKDDVAPPQPATTEVEQEPAAFEPIVRDQERRDAILDAFKVRSSRSSTRLGPALTPRRARSTRTPPTSEMRSALTSASPLFSRFRPSQLTPDAHSYHPISHHGTNMSPSGPVGYFLIDSLDSLLLVGLDDEYKRARDWVASVNFDLDDKFHTFEVRRRPRLPARSREEQD